jgi:LmbE family N-acetylglucosaminyl deacetylase
MITPGLACDKDVLKLVALVKEILRMPNLSQNFLFYGKNPDMQWIYLSPHLDDVALSCGGLVWEQTQAGQPASIWTICAGDVPAGPLSSFAQSLHARWQTSLQAVAHRRQEDIAACAHLSASYRHFTIPDCIYRRLEPGSLSAGEANSSTFIYASREAIFGPLHPAEAGLVRQLTTDLSQALPPVTELVCPLTLGGHVDHRLIRLAAEDLGRRLWYYADYPYAIEEMDQIIALEASGWQKALFPVSPSGLVAWQQAVAAHQSQISTFWPDLPAMRTALAAYLDRFGGVSLWRSP